MRWLLALLLVTTFLAGCGSSQPETATMPPAEEGTKPDRTAR